MPKISKCLKFGTQKYVYRNMATHTVKQISVMMCDTNLSRVVPIIIRRIRHYCADVIDYMITVT